jgi:hypothetical protein
MTSFSMHVCGCVCVCYSIGVSILYTTLLAESSSVSKTFFRESGVLLDRCKYIVYNTTCRIE